MKTRRFDFNFRPLQMNVSITTDSSVPDSQTYDADEKAYSPDYTITPCVIQPHVSRLDRDGYLSSGEVNGDSSRFSCKWSELKNGVEIEIADTNTDYQISRSGNDCGRILVKKNAKPQVPINLVFYCEYIDPRTGQIYRIKKPYQIPCHNETTFIPQLFLDAADQTIYNPLKDVDKQKVTASLRLGDKECEGSKRLFVWEILRDDNTWSAVGSDEMDYDVEVASDGLSVTVDRSLMGDKLFLRCRARYSRDGNPSSVVLDDASPTKIVCFVRRVPKLDYDMLGVPSNLPNGTLEFKPQAYITDTNGEIENPETYLLPVWSAATNGSGSLSFSIVATGMSPIIDTEPMSVANGAVYGIDVYDVGPIAVIEDSDNALFVDDDGNFITIK